MSISATNSKTSSSRAFFVLPDLHAMCPLEAGDINPHYRAAAKESSAWIHSYDAIPERKVAFFSSGVSELLVAHAYPYADYEQFRTCCDFVNLLFVIDEISDEQSGKGARATGDIFLKALRNPDAVNEHSDKLSKITKDFANRYYSLAGPQTAKRFVEACTNYIICVGKEAELRERDEILDLESFILLRRENSAVRAVFGLFEYALGIDLPDVVYDNETFMEMHLAAVDLVCWSNDLYSYKMEIAQGLPGNNVVTVLMKEKNISLQAACDYIGEYFQVLMDRYMAAREYFYDEDAPKPWGPDVDADVRKYVEAAGCWIIGNLDWSFESQRYFGAEHNEVKKTRIVTLSSSVPSIVNGTASRSAVSQ